MTADSLVAASDGLPGILRQLIEAGLSNGSLSLRSGVWRLDGGVTPPGDMAAAVRRRLDDLDNDQRDALELIAIAGDLELDAAFDMIDDEVLDRLELDGMVSVRNVGRSTRLRLSHPLYGEILLDGLTPLRDRRHRGQLATQLAERASTSAADRLQLVRLQLDSGSTVDSTMLIESAALALIEEDSTLALRLLRKVPDHDQTPRHQQLLGEVLYMRGRFDEAFETWNSLSLDELDDETGSGVLRRRTTWAFYGKWDFTGAIERLDAEMARYSGDQRLLLESYWCEIAALDGHRIDEVLERSDRLVVDASGHAKCDFLSAAAMADFIRGDYLRSLERIAACNQEAANAARTIHWTNSDYADFVEVLSNVELGRIDDAWATYERVSEPGAVPNFGFAATAAGRLALASGHWQQGLDWLEPKIQITEALGITTNGRPLQAQAAICALMLGRHEHAAAMAAAMRSDVPDHVNITTLDIRWSIARVEGAIGDRERAIAELSQAATDARAVGLSYIESVILAGLSHLGAAAQAVDRLEELTKVIDGDLIVLRHAAASALADGAPLDEVLRELDERSLVFEATSIRSARSSTAAT